jgi:hypothetical protein
MSKSCARPSRMAEGIPAAPAPVPAVEPVAAPVAPTPATLSEPSAPAAELTVAPAAVVTPLPSTEPAAAVAETPAPAAAPAAETPPVEAATAAEAAAPAAEAPPVEVKPEAPKYTEVLKAPAGLTVTPEQMTAYADILGKHNLPPEVGQELMDFGGSVIKQTEEKMVQRQNDVFADTRRGWVSDAQKRFGNHYDTTVNDAKAAVMRLIPDKKARAELWNVLGFTGAGDHPAVIGAFAAAEKSHKERAGAAQGKPMNGQRSENPADRRYAPKQ